MLYPDDRILLGVAPTRREDMNFPVPLALGQKAPVLQKLEALGIEFLSLEGICPDGLLATLGDVEAAAKAFGQAGVHALFVPSVVYGAEGPTALLARELRVPTLLWAPPDPLGAGSTGKPQLGIYTIGKALRRLGLPFTFLGSCGVESPLFEQGLRTFLAAANVVKEMRRAKVLQIGPRPESFWNVIVDEGALLERLGIPVYPVALPDLFLEYRRVLDAPPPGLWDLVEEYKRRTILCVKEEVVVKSAAMKLTLERLALESRSTAIAIQCWHALPRELGIWPCAAGAMLTERGLPVACEGDIHGAISCLLASAASRGKARPIFVDFDTGHPTDPNAFNVHHCAMAPISCYSEKPRFFRRKNPPDNDWGGSISGQFPPRGDVSLLRFDGDHGGYSVLLCKGRAVEGPAAIGKGSYGWYRVKDWPQLEEKLVRGPYIHHGVVLYDDILPAVYEALRYLPGIEPDFAFEEERVAVERCLYAR